MTDDRIFVLEFIAVQLVVVTAMIHVVYGLLEWWPLLKEGIPFNSGVHYPLFVFSGIALLGGVAYAHTRENRRPFYAAGIVIMLGYVFGYFLWHLLGHRRFIPFGEQLAPNGSESVSLQWFLDHLLEVGLAEFSAIIVEISAVIVLAALLYVTRADGSDDG